MYMIPRLSWNLNLMFCIHCQFPPRKEWLIELPYSFSQQLFKTKHEKHSVQDRVSFGDYVSLFLDTQKLYFYSTSKFPKTNIFFFIIFVLTQFLLIEIDELVWWASEIYFYWIMYATHYIAFTFKLIARQNGKWKHEVIFNFISAYMLHTRQVKEKRDIFVLQQSLLSVQAWVAPILGDWQTQTTEKKKLFCCFFLIQSVVSIQHRWKMKERDTVCSNLWCDMQCKLSKETLKMIWNSCLLVLWRRYCLNWLTHDVLERLSI